MENTIEQKSRTRKVVSMKSGNSSKGSTLVGDPRESKEERVSGPMGYSYDISSEKLELPPPTLKKRIQASNFVQRKGGWKRLLLIALILLLCIIAIVVGVVVGLSQQKKNDRDDSAASTQGASVGVVGAAGASPTSGVGSSPTSTNVPNNFPVGSYSFSTFLDTVNADCTADASTWSCFPYTIYNDDKVKALTTFNWIIKAGSTKGSFVISSDQNPFAINFENAAMKMVDKDGDNERYQFQVTMDKTVVPSGPISEDGSAATCVYNDTTMTGYLYTKRAKNYPSAGMSTANATYQAWPYAVRVEQTVGGGENVPQCFKTTNGNLGERIGNTTATDPTTLCSCLYRNFLTPGS